MNPTQQQCDGPYVAGRRPTRVLVVDDDHGTLETFRAVLSHAGCAVTVAASARDAVRHSRTARFDVALVDLNLGSDSGLSIVRALAPAKVIVVTGFGEIPSAVQAMREGATDFVEKPVIGDELVNLVASAAGETSELPAPPVRAVALKLVETDNDLARFVALVSEFSRVHSGVDVLDGVSIQRAVDGRVQELLRTLAAGESNALRRSEAEWASHFGLAPSHLGRMIKHQTGLPFRMWRRCARLKSACGLLETAVSISHIARVTGFDDVSQFRREFRSLLGLLPSEFRCLIPAPQRPG